MCLVQFLEECIFSANPFCLSSTIVLLVQDFNRRREEKDLSHSHVVTGKVPNIRSAIFIFLKPENGIEVKVEAKVSGIYSVYVSQ